MVNRGPSTGCNTCRQRRIKCDEARPACQNCLRKGLNCLGYRSLFDRAHRDVTDVTRRRCQMKSGIGPQSSSSSITRVSPVQSVSSEAWSGRSSPDITDHVAFVVGAIPAKISRGYEAAACDWFIAVFAEHPSSTRANADFLLHLFPMLQETAESSPLHRAVSAIAISFAGIMTRNFEHANEACANYTKASHMLRKDISDPFRRLDDDVLMTTLMLGFYDSVNGHFQTAHDSHESHLLGALALIDQRRTANNKNETSIAMVNHVRTSLLQHFIHTRQTLPTTSLALFKYHKLPRTHFRHLNEVSRDLVDLLAQSNPVPKGPDGMFAIIASIEGLVEVDRQLVEWYNTLPADRFPVSIRSDELPRAIREAGIYQDSCSVYKNLQIATMLNLWRSRRLLLLHRLWIFVSLSTSYGYGAPPEGYEDIPAISQWLTDGICESVPFLLGDLTRTKLAVLAPDICFPSITMNGTPFPESYSNHVRHATASGAWLMMEPLLQLCHLTQRSLGIYSLKLRKGQIVWVKQQLKRLHQGVESCRCGEHLSITNDMLC